MEYPTEDQVSGLNRSDGLDSAVRLVSPASLRRRNYDRNGHKVKDRASETMDNGSNQKGGIGSNQFGLLALCITGNRRDRIRVEAIQPHLLHASTRKYSTRDYVRTTEDDSIAENVAAVFGEVQKSRRAATTVEERREIAVNHAKYLFRLGWTPTKETLIRYMRLMIKEPPDPVRTDSERAADSRRRRKEEALKNQPPK